MIGAFVIVPYAVAMNSTRVEFIAVSMWGEVGNMYEVQVQGN